MDYNLNKYTIQLEMVSFSFVDANASSALLYLAMLQYLTLAVC